MIKYEVTVPYLITIKHIIEIDPDNMPPFATTPKQLAIIRAESKEMADGEITLKTLIEHDTGFIYPSTAKEIK